MSVYRFIIRDEVINCQLSSSVNIIYDIRKGHSVVWFSLPIFCSSFLFSLLSARKLYVFLSGNSVMKHDVLYGNWRVLRHTPDLG